MKITEAIKVITVVVNQYKNAYAITQSDYNQFLDALDLLNAVKNNIEVS